jgi:hypothetical protein
VLWTVLVLVALAFALAACGGGDEGGPQQAVRDFVEATNERDGERLCGDLVTREYKERATGATGDRVDEVCRRQLELTQGLRLELLGIGKTVVEGDSATVRTRLDIDGVKGPRLFRLEREDGSWKLASGSGG